MGDDRRDTMGPDEFRFRVRGFEVAIRQSQWLPAGLGNKCEQFMKGQVGPAAYVCLPGLGRGREIQQIGRDGIDVEPCPAPFGRTTCR